MNAPLADGVRALDRALDLARLRARGRPALVGLSGAQGSGKSTLASQFARARASVVHVSLDDFYLPQTARAEKARVDHPLFATRGPPGTHDIALLGDTIGALLSAGPDTITPLPLFDKVADDRRPRTQWNAYRGRPEAVVLEGWCVGARAQTQSALTAPINAMEAAHDQHGTWRRLANAHLAGAYTDLFTLLDAIVFLRAPSFDAVFAWRCEQEEGLLGRAMGEEDFARLSGFIAHFERLTRHMLAGGRRADAVVALDEARNARLLGTPF